MVASQYDVVVVGAGCAGLTAAIALARAGFAVAVVEAAPFPGAENWSGCVYYTENLAEPDVLGPEGVEALAWERRLVERGLFTTDGHGLLGFTYRDPDAFRHCYTVLRPIFDHHLAAIAAQHGVAFLTATTVESLIREAGRVVGVCTARGPLYADLVYLAEGDAAYLLTREGYARSSDPRDAPRYLLGLKQVIDLPPGAIEERFGVGAEEGVAHEILLRNGTLNGRPVALNMGAFLYTNRQGLSVGLVLPADNLHQHFRGDPALLLDWFHDLPALRPWLRDGRRGTAGAKLVRGGGARDVPHLVDDGLAVGGAASAIGTDFPFPNFIGPATGMGLLLARAAVRIRSDGSRFTRETLRQHYLEPLHRTHYWQNVAFLRRWPGYIKRTRVLFHRTLDLALGSAYVWTRPRRWFPARLLHWVRLLLHEGIPGRWAEMQADLARLGWALRLREVVGRPPLGKVLLEGALNAFRDFLRLPRVGLPPAGTLRLHYTVAGGEGGRTHIPGAVRRWFDRFAPVLAATVRGLCRNDAVHLSDRVRNGARLLLRQMNLFDVIAAGVLVLMTAVTSTFLSALRGLRRRRGRRRVVVPRGGPVKEHVLAVRQNTDLSGTLSLLGEGESRLPGVVVQPAPAAAIHVLWPRSLPEKNAIVGEGLWHVCPGRVFEARFGPFGQAQVLVHAERCIKCEACWRSSRLVDWGRDGRQQLLYRVQTPVMPRLLEAADRAGLLPPVRPRIVDPWAPRLQDLAAHLAGEQEDTRKRWDPGEPARLRCLLGQIERKLEEFDEALAEGSPGIDRVRGAYLEMLAHYAHRLSLEVVAVLGGSAWAESWSPGVAAVGRTMLGLAAEMAATAEARARRTWDSHYAWAAGDGRQLRQHHLTGLRRLLEVLDPGGATALPASAAFLPTAAPTANSPAGIAAELCRRAAAFAAIQVAFPGLFDDDQGRDSLGKFGAVKALLSEAAARRYLIEVLTLGPAPARHSRISHALVTDALGAAADRVRRVFACAGVEDAAIRELTEAAWTARWQTTPAPAVFRAHGAALLRDWHPDGSSLYAVEDEDGFVDEIARRQALLAEWEEIQHVTECLVARVNDWSRNTGPDVADDRFNETLGRLDAYLLGGKALLRRTHAHLETGLPAEIEVSLLRVWLDHVTLELDDLTARTRLRLTPRPYDVRPLVEPGAGLPPAGLAAYRASPVEYESGTFLVAPVDLLRPRLVPEMVVGDASLGEVQPLEWPPLQLAGGSTSVFDALDLGNVSKLLAPATRIGEWAERGRADSRMPEDGAPAWGVGRLHELEEERFIAEAVAFDVAGLLLHPGTRSAGLESALAGVVLAELLERAAEAVAELRAQSREGLTPAPPPCEEGAGILPRVYILQQLAEVVAPRCVRGEGVGSPRHLGREALELEALAAGFRERLVAVHASFGAGLWQNSNLQVGFFALADAASWLKAAESTLGRVAWLERTVQEADEDAPAPQRDLGSAAFVRCCGRVWMLLRRFDEELVHLRRGYYAPQVRAGNLLLDQISVRTHATKPAHRIECPLRILVVLEPTPLIHALPGDSLSDPWWALTPADQAALETALQMRDAATAPVRLAVAALGPDRVGPALRAVQALGIDRLTLEATASALVHRLEEARPFDLILGPLGGSIIPRLADGWGLNVIAKPDHLSLWVTSAGSRLSFTRKGETVSEETLPVVVGLEGDLPLRPFTVAGYLQALGSEGEGRSS